MTRDLTGKIVAIAQARRRFGYRRIHDLLRPEFPGVNHKRVYRLYSAANLAVRRRKKTRRPASARVLLQIAQHVNEVWSMDFVSDSLANARRIKCLTVADDFSHECVEIAVDWGISGQYVTRVLDRAARFRGYPLAVRTDNGPEFTSRAFMAWAQSHGIRHILIEPGQPMQNGYIESFNGKFRDECLNEQWFETLHQARSAISTWRQDYNEVRPHSLTTGTAKGGRSFSLRGLSQVRGRTSFHPRSMNALFVSCASTETSIPLWAVIEFIASKLGYVPQTLNEWIKRDRSIPALEMALPLPSCSA